MERREWNKTPSHFWNFTYAIKTWRNWAQRDPHSPKSNTPVHGGSEQVGWWWALGYPSPFGGLCINVFPSTNSECDFLFLMVPEMPGKEQGPCLKLTTGGKLWNTAIALSILGASSVGNGHIIHGTDFLGKTVDPNHLRWKWFLRIGLWNILCLQHLKSPRQAKGN